MDKLIKHAGRCVPLFLPNIDTDQIVPKKFLLRVARTGYDDALFYEWRFLADGTPIEGFVLNDPRYDGASVLISGPNFGCGSSREHAPWALYEYGFRVIIAPSFADIFYNNCFKTGILPVILEEAVVRKLADFAAERTDFNVSLDLPSQTISAQGLATMKFEVDEFGKQCLIGGMDEIALTLDHSDLISEFEQQNPTFISP